MIDDMEINRRTWTAAFKLAAVLSVVSAALAIALASLGDVSAIALVVPVMIVAFVASWVQTDRIRRHALDDLAILPAHSLRSTLS